MLFKIQYFARLIEIHGIFSKPCFTWKKCSNTALISFLFRDLSKGKERVPILVENTVDEAVIDADFRYISEMTEVPFFRSKCDFSLVIRLILFALLALVC